MKHGYTSRGIHLPDEDAEEVDRRFADYQADLKPRTALERDLVRRTALYMTRLDRLADHDAKETSLRMRNAVAAFDDARKAEVERLYAWIGAEPVTNTRRLRDSPEGIVRLIEAIEALRSDLARPGGYRWDTMHSEQLHHLLGIRSADLPITRVRALSDAIAGRFDHLRDDEGEGLDHLGRRLWALHQLVYYMDDRIAELKRLLEEFDRSGLDLDRSEAPARAIFDASPESILARKYEGATERALFRTLRELRELQDREPQAEETEGVAPEPAEELGSFARDAEEGEDAEVVADSADAFVARPTPPRRPDLARRARKGRRRSKST